MIDNVYLACCGVSRGRFSLLRPRRNDALMQAAENLVQAVHLTDVKDQLVAELSHGQQRQLEIALALAGAPRFILFDEPAAGPLADRARRADRDPHRRCPRISATSSSSTTWTSRCAWSRA